MSYSSRLQFSALILILSLLFACKSNEPLTLEEGETTEAIETPKVETSEAEVVPPPTSEPPTPPAPEVEVRDSDWSEPTGADYSATDASYSKEAGKSRGAVSSKVMMAESSADMMAVRKGAPESVSGGVRPIDPDEVKDYSAGQLTAAEWNDLYNWEDWKELLDNQDYNEMQAHWHLYPRTRYSVFVRNKYELPLPDVKVNLLDKSGKVLWSAHTDNAGRAELWSDIKSKDKSFEDVDARYVVEGKVQTIENLKTIEEGVNHFTADVECRTSKNVDIVFAVDATGSMGDEIRYLQSELKNVIERSLTGNAKLDVNLGAVFYRDTSDAYLTRVQPLSQDADETLKFIDGQGSGGGGDYPEAVDAALADALAMDWSEDAVARIIFLLLDAPPHHNPEVLERLQSQVEEAASLGIKIIPITASGINRQTEFLMKFMAIATNGTYVFITDHSGIGNPHLDPVVKDYEVEKLNDLLVRLLYNYTKSNGCNANDPEIAGLKLSPNPASSFVNVKSDNNLKTIKVLSNTGKLMHTETVTGKESKLKLEGLVDGIYTIQCFGDDGKSYAEPLVVVSGR